MATTAHGQPTSSGPDLWPELPLEAWQDTYATLHMWMQIVGKVRLALSPWLNHSWHATLYVTARGLTTGLIPHDSRMFQIDFDFVSHRLIVQCSDGRSDEFALEPQSVAAFHSRLMKTLGALALHADISSRPNEVAEPIPFAKDVTHRSYDAEYAHRYWRILVLAAEAFGEFRARFIGKSSPVHVFWGAPDLAVTRFSGRSAPEHPGGVPNLPDRVAREAYSHEVSSCGFWPGGGPIPYPAFYAYAYPEPEGYASARVEPGHGFYSTDMHEFVLPYDAVRQSLSPREMLLSFLQTTYEAAASLGQWERAALERTQDLSPARAGMDGSR